MKFFLDTANVSEIESFLKWGCVDGVTTNPSLIAKEGVVLEKRIKEICEIVSGPVSAEVLSLEAKDMVLEGEKISKWAKNVFVKLPMTESGLIACRELSQRGIKVNMTLIFSVPQAILAVKAGAKFISPFVGRIDDTGHDGMMLIAEIRDVLENYEFDAEVLVASVRGTRHVVEAGKMGAQIVTMPADVLKKCLYHPLTDMGLKKFMEDARGEF